MGIKLKKLMGSVFGAGASASVVEAQSRVIDPNSINEQHFNEICQGLQSIVSGSHEGDGKVDVRQAVKSLKRMSAVLNLGDHFEYSNEGTFKKGTSRPVELNGAYGQRLQAEFEALLNHENWKHSPDNLGELLRAMPQEFKFMELDDGNYMVGTTINVEKTRLKNVVASMKEERRQEQRLASRAIKVAAYVAANEFKNATESVPVQSEVKQGEEQTLREMLKRADGIVSQGSNVSETEHVTHTEKPVLPAPSTLQ